VNINFYLSSWINLSLFYDWLCFSKFEKLFKTSKCFFMSVARILFIVCFLTSIKLWSESVYKIFVFLWVNTLKSVAVWCYSKTDSSLYFKAILERLFVSKRFVLPVWSISCPREENNSANFSISSKYLSKNFSLMKTKMQWATVNPWL